MIKNLTGRKQYVKTIEFVESLNDIIFHGVRYYDYEDDFVISPIDYAIVNVKMYTQSKQSSTKLIDREHYDMFINNCNNCEREYHVKMTVPTERQWIKISDNIDTINHLLRENRESPIDAEYYWALSPYYSVGMCDIFSTKWNEVISIVVSDSCSFNLRPIIDLSSK